MWFMKENRPKLMEELGYKEKQSAELNKELGKRWHDLPKEEQQKCVLSRNLFFWILRQHDLFLLDLSEDVLTIECNFPPVRCGV